MRAIIATAIGIVVGVVQAQPTVPRLRQSTMWKSPLASSTAKGPYRTLLPPPNAGRDDEPFFSFPWNPFKGEATKNTKEPRKPPAVDKPRNGLNFLTMHRMDEEGMECEQAHIPMNHENVEMYLEFGGFQGFEKGNCYLEGYTQPIDAKVHDIPFIGKITMRHFTKSSNLGSQVTVKKADPLLELQTDPQINITLTGLIGIAMCVGGAITILLFSYRVTNKERQPMNEALI